MGSNRDGRIVAQSVLHCNRNLTHRTRPSRLDHSYIVINTIRYVQPGCPWTQRFRDPFVFATHCQRVRPGICGAGSARSGAPAVRPAAGLPGQLQQSLAAGYQRLFAPAGLAAAMPAWRADGAAFERYQRAAARLAGARGRHCAATPAGALPRRSRTAARRRRPSRASGNCRRSGSNAAKPPMAKRRAAKNSPRPRRSCSWRSSSLRAVPS